MPLLVLSGIAHWCVWAFGFQKYQQSLPRMDYTWTFTSYDERNAVYEPQWGAPTPAPTAAGDFDDYGCQTELMDEFMTLQVVVGLVGAIWMYVLWKLATFVPKVRDKDELEKMAKEGGLEAMKAKLGQKKERGLTQDLLHVDSEKKVLEGLLTEAVEEEERKEEEEEEEREEARKKKLERADTFGAAVGEEEKADLEAEERETEGKGGEAGVRVVRGCDMVMVPVEDEGGGVPVEDEGGGVPVEDEGGGLAPPEIV